jgi:hypothetical protein
MLTEQVHPLRGTGRLGRVDGSRSLELPDRLGPAAREVAGLAPGGKIALRLRSANARGSWATPGGGRPRLGAGAT